MGSDARRVAFFVTVDWYFCNHYLDLARAIRDAGYAVTLITGIDAHEGPIREAGLDLIPFEVSRKGLDPRRELRTILRLVRVLRDLRPALLHNIAQKPVLYGTLAARLAGVPAVVNGVAGMGYLFTAETRRARLLRYLVGGAYRALLAAPNVRVLVQNSDDQATVQAFTGVMPILIPGSGVDLARFTPRDRSTDPQAPAMVVLASRMLWDKGIGDFVAAARILRQHGCTARFVLVGKPDAGNPASVSEAQLRDWDREGVVEWWGHRADMPRILAEAQIACLPSYREGLPKFLIEAAAAGLPLVTTDATGCREVVESGVNGLLVPLRSPEALASALRRLLDDECLRADMGARGRVLAEARFGHARIAGLVQEVYRDLLDPPR